MRPTETTEPEAEAEREIVISRVIDGPRSLLFRAWTETRHLARWFGPHGFTTTTRAFEFRPGGVWDFDMTGPDGTVFPNWVEWSEIVPGERIAYRQGERADDPDAFETTVTFVERAGGTEITLRTLFRTRARRDYVAESFGAIEGGHETLERLGGYVEELRTADAPA